MVCIIALPRIINSFDVPFHIARIVGAWLGWQSGQLVPYVNPVALHGLGLGSNYFYGTWEAFIVAPIYGLTRSIATTFVIFNVIATMLAGIFMDKFLRDYFDSTAVILASAFYMSSPFMIHNLIVTQDQGAIIGIMMLPIILGGVFKILSQKPHGVRWLSLGSAALVSSHLLSTFLAVVAIIVILLCSWPKIKLVAVLNFVEAGILSLVLSAFFWIPFIQLKNLKLYNVFYSHIYVMDRTAKFLTHSNSWQPYSFLIKIINVLLFCILIYVAIRWREIKHRNSNEQQWLLKSGIVIALIFTFLSYAPLNWQYLPSIFYNMQFLWRFMYIGYFSFALVIAGTLNQLRLKQPGRQFVIGILFFSVLLLALGQSWQYGRSVRRAVDTPIRVNTLASGYKLYNPHSKSDAWYFEYASIGTYKNQSILDAKVPILAKKNATTENIHVDNRNTHSLIKTNVNAKADAFLIFKKIYYPGYYVQMRMHGKTVSKLATYNRDGLVAINLPQNFHGSVTLGYQTPILYLWAWALSVVTLIITFLSFWRKNPFIL